MQEVPCSSLTFMENWDKTLKPAYKKQLNHHQKQENKKRICWEQWEQNLTKYKDSTARY